MRRLMAVLVFVFIFPLLSAATLSAQEQATTPPPSNPSLMKFTITLLLGDTEAGPSGTLSPAAAKAIADLKDFLPYKRFHVLDTLPIIGLRSPTVKLRAPTGDQYDFTMNATERPGNTIAVMLRLLDPGSSARQPATLIDTQFNMAVGETVVVGTSRLEATKALILLVTSVR
jgi:hypothetical protein